MNLDPNYIEYNKTEIYDFLILKKIGVDFRKNNVYEGIDKFRERKAIKFIQIPQLIKLKCYLEEPLMFQGSNCQYIDCVEQLTVMSGFKHVMATMRPNKTTLAQMIISPGFSLQQRFEVIKQIGLGIQYIHMDKKSAVKNLRPQSIFYMKSTEPDDNEKSQSKIIKKITLGSYSIVSQQTLQIIQKQQQFNNSNLYLQKQSQIQIQSDWYSLYQAPEISHDFDNNVNMYDTMFLDRQLPMQYYNNNNNNDDNQLNNYEIRQPYISNQVMPITNYNTYSKKSDIWAYGIITVEMLVGKRFQQLLKYVTQNNNNNNQHIKQHQQFSQLLLKDYFPQQNPHSIFPSKRNKLKQLLQKMLHTNPYNRPSITQTLRLLQICINQMQKNDSNSFLDHNLFNNLKIVPINNNNNNNSQFNRDSINNCQIPNGNNNTAKYYERCNRNDQQCNMTECDDIKHQINSILYDSNYALDPLKISNDLFQKYLQIQQNNNNSIQQVTTVKRQQPDNMNNNNDKVDYRVLLNIQSNQQNYDEMKKLGVYNPYGDYYPVVQNNGNVSNIQNIHSQTDKLDSNMDYQRLFRQYQNRQKLLLQCFYRPSTNHYLNLIQNTTQEQQQLVQQKQQQQNIPKILNLNGLAISNQLPIPLLPTTQINSLYLSYNNINNCTIFNSLRNLHINNYKQKLQILNISHNQIAYLHGLQNFSKLKQLYLHNNKIQLSIMSIASLGQEQQQNYSNADILAQLTELTYLGLSYNHLRLYGQDVGLVGYLLNQLVKLQIIDLRNNLFGSNIQAEVQNKEKFGEELGNISNKGIVILID